VLDETKTIDNVETRVIEERETLGGEPVEVSRNFFAIDKHTHDVYYFGEEVDEYKDGKIASHGGAWESGKNGAHYGLALPAEPKVGRSIIRSSPEGRDGPRGGREPSTRSSPRPPASSRTCSRRRRRRRSSRTSWSTSSTRAASGCSSTRT
jgi:hypothetical protein